MTITEAIEIKTKYQYVLPKESYPELIEADNLSIEALRRIAQIRVIELDPELHHLPGETEE